jgi:hypothetical protein
MDAMGSGLFGFRKYGYFVVDLYNGYRAHTSLEGQTPIKTPESEGVNFKCYRWHKHCRGLYQTPTAA